MRVKDGELTNIDEDALAARARAEVGRLLEEL
jgi:hypothetical protein